MLLEKIPGDSFSEIMKYIDIKDLVKIPTLNRDCKKNCKQFVYNNITISSINKGLNYAKQFNNIKLKLIAVCNTDEDVIKIMSVPNFIKLFLTIVNVTKNKFKELCNKNNKYY
jgi:hypothetical protein